MCNAMVLIMDDDCTSKNVVICFLLIGKRIKQLYNNKITAYNCLCNCMVIRLNELNVQTISLL